MSAEPARVSKVSLVPSPPDVAKAAWTETKSPLPFQIRRFVSREGREAAILIDSGSGPAFYPTVFITCKYDKAGASASTREMVLRSIGMARAWAQARGRDLDRDLRHGPFLTPSDAEALSDHLMLSAEAQAAANAKALGVHRPSRTVLGLERLRPSSLEISRTPPGIRPGSAFPRIKWVAIYVEWHLQQRVGAADRSRNERDDMRKLGAHVLARLRERSRGNDSRSMDDEVLEGVPQEVIDLVTNALRAGDPLNPFTPGFVRARNELLWHLYICTGGRRAEVQSVLVKHVEIATRRLYFSKSKTQPRWVRISHTAARTFDRFIEQHWSKLPLAARKRGFLFTSESGKPLSVRAINRIFVSIRSHVPGCPNFLVPHTTRRSWNDRFSEMMDALPPEKRPGQEQEIRTRNTLQGWSGKSSMGALYANRHIRKKSDQLGEILANDIAKDTDARDKA